MVPALPYAEYEVPWEGDGPSSGAGQADSDPRYGGEQVMAVASVSLQYVHALVPPRPNTFIYFEGPSLYPADAIEFAVGPLPLGGTLHYINQDTVPGGIVAEDYPADVTLAAPPIPIGGTYTRGGR